jgi:hypothetical protein
MVPMTPGAPQNNKTGKIAMGFALTMDGIEIKTKTPYVSGGG